MLILNWGHFFQVIKCLICNHWAGAWRGSGQVIRGNCIPQQCWDFVWEAAAWPLVILCPHSCSCWGYREFNLVLGVWNIRGDSGSFQQCCDTEQESLCPWWVATLPVAKDGHTSGGWSTELIPFWECTAVPAWEAQPENPNFNPGVSNQPSHTLLRPPGEHPARRRCCHGNSKRSPLIFCALSRLAINMLLGWQHCWV